MSASSGAESSSGAGMASASDGAAVEAPGGPNSTIETAFDKSAGITSSDNDGHSNDMASAAAAVMMSAASGMGAAV
jgi:hypothetical protein